jgi:type IX secretion system PorP/SprF family membrane protein
MWTLLRIAGCVLLAVRAAAQDIHFTQFDQAPFNINPGLTGHFEGRHRFLFNQRTQWRSVTTPFTTWGVTYDWRIPGEFRLFRTNKPRQGECPPKHRPWNLGVSFYTDRTGDSRLTMNHFSLNISNSQLAIGGVSVVPGISMGVTTLNIDYSALQFDNQWNGLVYNPSLPTGEQFARDARSYWHVHAGVLFRGGGSSGNRWDAGVALYHLSSPRESWFDQGFVRLDRRWNVHGRYHWALSQQWVVEPTALFMRQGPHREFNVGARAYYVLDVRKWMYRALFAGFIGRTRDAGAVVVGMRYDGWTVGVSYDINTSDLTTASNGRGGLEWSVGYILPTRPRVCPDKKVCRDYL